jgi:hypothetical protein
MKYCPGICQEELRETAKMNRIDGVVAEILTEVKGKAIPVTGRGGP